MAHILLYNIPRKIATAFAGIFAARGCGAMPGDSGPGGLFQSVKATPFMQEAIGVDLQLKV